MTMMDDFLNETEKRLQELGISTERNKSTINDIIDIEETYDIKLPESYKRFLLKYGNFNFREPVCYQTIEKTPWSDEDHLETLSSIFGLDAGKDNIKDILDQYIERVPSSLFPFADDGTGNLLCIGLDDEHQEKVFFWNHEEELAAKILLNEDIQVTSVDDYWNNIYLVANSFIDFLRSLELKKEEKIDNINSKIVGMSDDFMEQMRLSKEKLEKRENGM